MASAGETSHRDIQGSRRRHRNSPGHRGSTADLIGLVQEEEQPTICNQSTDNQHPHRKHHAPAYRSEYPATNEIHHPTSLSTDTYSDQRNIAANNSDGNKDHRNHFSPTNSASPQLYDLPRPNTSTTTTSTPSMTPSPSKSPCHQTLDRGHQHPSKCCRTSSTKGQSKSSELMKLNVGGVRFSTYRSTLEKKPCTLLYGLRNTDDNYDPVNKEWFFDRNPAIFSSVLDYLRDDHHELHFPHNFCGPSIKVSLRQRNCQKKPQN